MWSGADLLGYYGSILGSSIAAIILVVTIVFTKKQIQRESYLKKDEEKWAKIEEIFSHILVEINPINIHIKTMDNGLQNPQKVIRILQNYQITCKTTGEQLNSHLCNKDLLKTEELLNNIAEATKKFINISQLQIDLYFELTKLELKSNAEQMLSIEAQSPGSLNMEKMIKCQNLINQAKNICREDIEKELLQHKLSAANIYETTYRPLLKLKGTTFEKINNEIQQNADNILHLIS